MTRQAIAAAALAAGLSGLPAAEVATARNAIIILSDDHRSVPAYKDTVRAMRDRLFNGLESTGGMQVPVRRGDFQAAERRLP
jgi:hypothetical protein